MRLSRTDLVAGVPAPVARELMRDLFEERDKQYAREVLEQAGVDDGAQAVERLLEAGYLQGGEFGDDSVVSTRYGNALGMASFGRPIKRATAERLVREMIERAEAYNADVGKPRFIRRIRIFGSYLDPQVDRLGDVDVEATFESRNGISRDELLTYHRASGRIFPTHMERLFWPEVEARRLLKGKSNAISLHDGDEGIERFTDRIETVFEAIQTSETDWDASQRN